MPIIKQTCPHCRTRGVAFTAATEWHTPKGRRALFHCGSCSEGIIREFISANQLSQLGGDLANHNVVLGEQWPTAPSGDAPEDTPSNVARFFEQGTSSLESSNFDAAGMMFRKTLEAATKILDADLAGKTLVKRVDALTSSGRLTEDMAKWAHEVRLGGNDAAHEEEPFSMEEALALKNFTENFLRYVFTLPAAVERRSIVTESN